MVPAKLGTLATNVAVLFLAAVGVAGSQTSGAGSLASSQQRPQVNNSLAATNLREIPLRIAITFDDLPAHSALPPGETRLQVASKIIAALHDGHLPPTYGFVNGLRVEEQPTDAAVLQAGRAAGYPLGNHAWSHMNLNQHAPAELEAHVTRTER